ncbi:hypothetical protein F8388_025425 [Cannabis sativa]|uniref:RING-type E3 ubiquitin transferase n=1 Tax=Cannabis sativa TaxID=3483 RepID=A0A7J6G0M7_CANSA|nr:hypothetical protein F8388_025425 [Cannabis sativa]
MAVGKIMVMAIVISIILLFFGIAMLIFVHVCIVGRAFRRGLENVLVPERGGATLTTTADNTSMSKDDLEKLPSFHYKTTSEDDDDVDDDVECSVCLESFQMGDKCRLLPTCNHSFHAECVDTWLLRTPFCPICRTGADSRKGDDLSQTTESSSRFSDTNNNNNNDIRIDIGDGDSGGEMSHGRIEDVGNGDNNHIIEFGMNEIVQTECVEKLGELNVGTCSNNSGSKSEENFQGDEVSIFKSEYFLAPGGRPLGLRLPTSIAPSLGSSLFSLSSSSSWFPPPAVLLIEIPRSGFFIGDELVEVSTTPCKPICPPHQRLRGEEYEYLYIHKYLIGETEKKKLIRKKGCVGKKGKVVWGNM